MSRTSQCASMYRAILPNRFGHVPQDQVRDVGAVVAVAKLDEGLGPDEFRRPRRSHRWRHRSLSTEHWRTRRRWTIMVPLGEEKMTSKKVFP